MSRLVGMGLFVVLVVGIAGGTHVRAQENATLEQRVTALEATVAVLQANAVPRSPNLAADGSARDISIVFTDPALGATFLCQQWDPLVQLNPLVRSAVAPGLVGLHCELAPAAAPPPPAASTETDPAYRGNMVDAALRTPDPTSP